MGARGGVRLPWKPSLLSNTQASRGASQCPPLPGRGSRPALPCPALPCPVPARPASGPGARPWAQCEPVVRRRRGRTAGSAHGPPEPAAPSPIRPPERHAAAPQTPIARRTPRRARGANLVSPGEERNAAQLGEPSPARPGRWGAWWHSGGLGDTQGGPPKCPEHPDGALRVVQRGVPAWRRARAPER